MSSLTVGIVGCGWMGRDHAERYGSIDRTDVVAAADFDETSLESFRADYDVERTYESHEALLSEETPDILSVCTWQGSHAQLTIDACEAGVRGVLCEKPMATSMGETLDMLDAAERNDVHLVIGHQRRYARISERVRQLVSDDAIGDPEVVRTRAQHGLLNWGTHLVDLTRYVLGDTDPAWVAGHVERETDRYERGEPAEDRCVGVVAFGSGARLLIEMETPEPNDRDIAFDVYGSDGTISLELGERATVTNANGRSVYEPESRRDQQRELLAEFVELVLGERVDHRCEASTAAPTMEIMMGLYESVRTNQVVEFPLQTRVNPLGELIESDLEPTHPGRYDIRRPYESIR